jgi:methionine-rich copper-binding protein CopC
MSAAMIYLKIALFFLFQLGIASVQAHAFIEQSQPKAGEELNVSPKAIELTFDRNLEPALSNIQISEIKSKTRIKTGKALGIEGEPNKLSLSLPELAQGKYQVNWVAMSQDGHQTIGDYHFIVK